MITRPHILLLFLSGGGAKQQVPTPMAHRRHRWQQVRADLSRGTFLPSCLTHRQTLTSTDGAYASRLCSTHHMCCPSARAHWRACTDAEASNTRARRWLPCVRARAGTTFRRSLRLSNCWHILIHLWPSNPCLPPCSSPASLHTLLASSTFGYGDCI